MLSYFLRYILQDAILLFKVYSTRCYLTFLVNELETKKKTKKSPPNVFQFFGLSQQS